MLLLINKKKKKQHEMALDIMTPTSDIYTEVITHLNEIKYIAVDPQWSQMTDHWLSIYVTAIRNRHIITINDFYIILPKW